MKAKDLRAMSKADLDSKLIELKKEMIKHNAQIATGTTPKSPGQVKQIKKTIAKILTIESERKLGEAKSPSVSTQESVKKEENPKKEKESKLSNEKDLEETKTPQKEKTQKTEEKING